MIYRSALNQKRRIITAGCEIALIPGKSMILPNGTIQPTGKAYHLPMATLGHWNKQGTMSEEYLFWDNATLMQQIGATK